jgi:gluconokinase
VCHTAVLAMVILLMGVTGSGKTTVGRLLAQSLDWEFLDADGYHPAGNVKKMSAGIPLTDADRAPWLKAIVDAAVQRTSRGNSVVLACSALKRSYRDQLRAIPQLKIVYLKGGLDLIRPRVQARTSHFAKADLVATQFDVLEEPDVGSEHVVIVDISAPPAEIANEIRRQLKL